jgi:pimeloyl-ACP methyl ester carboxylesterase
MSLLRPLPQPDEDWGWITTEVPPPGAWLDRGGKASVKIRARYWPGGELRRPVVLVHGLIVASGMCVPVAERLAPDGPVYAPDLPGCGRSSKPRPAMDIPELGEVLVSWTRENALRPILVGTSLGAQVVLAAAVRSPESFSGIVLVSPIVDDQRRSWLSQLPRWQLEQASQSWRLRFLQLRDYARAGIRRARRTFSAALRYETESEIQRLEIPALVVYAGRDPLLRREWVKHLAHRAPGAKLATVPGALHAMSHENPMELARLVNAFADRLDNQGQEAA